MVLCKFDAYSAVFFLSMLYEVGGTGYGEVFESHAVIAHGCSTGRRTSEVTVADSMVSSI